MSKDKRKIPKRRFPEFSGDWEEKKLGDIAIRVKRKAPLNSHAPVMMISANEGFILQSEKYSTNNAGNSLKNYTWLFCGELAYNHGYSKLRNFGSCFDLRIPEARVPFVYHTFSLPNDDSIFFGCYLNSGRFDLDLRQKISSTARMDGLLNISFDDYMSLQIKRPTYAEQVRIGNFFRQLDDLITKQQQKIEKLQATKSAYLTQMFPAEGEKQPRLRFPEFSGDWEEKKLGDISISYSGGTPTVGIPEYYAGNIPFIRSSEIHTNSTELFISEEGLNNSSAKLVEPGIILCIIWCQVVRLIFQTYGAINQAILAIKLFLFDAHFLVKWLQSNRDNITAYIYKRTRWFICTIVKNIIIPSPPTPNKSAFGDFANR